MPYREYKIPLDSLQFALLFSSLSNWLLGAVGREGMARVTLAAGLAVLVFRRQLARSGWFAV